MKPAQRRMNGMGRAGRILVGLGAGIALIVGGAAVGVSGMIARAGGEKCAAAARAAANSTPAAAMFGPPMVCHEVLIGTGKSLPWDSGSFGTDPKYDITRLPADTVDLLIKEPSALVRMETLRRAAVYLSANRAKQGAPLAWELIGRRAGWVMLGEASGKRDPSAWFDVAYFIGCLNQVQMGVEVGGEVAGGFRFAEADGVPGYLFIKKAFQTAAEQNWSDKDLAEMQLGAAIMTFPAMRHKDWDYAIGTKDDIYDKHVLAALRAARGNDLLETNIAAHLKTYGKSIDQVRKVAAGK